MKQILRLSDKKKGILLTKKNVRRQENLFVYLAILSDRQTQVLFVVKHLTGHDGLQAESIRYSSLRREEVQQFYGM